MKRLHRPITILLIGFSTIKAYGQLPTITSFTPATGPVGTLVTFTGTNFNMTAASNLVAFGATNATVTSATAKSLVVMVSAGATYHHRELGGVIKANEIIESAKDQWDNIIQQTKQGLRDLDNWTPTSAH